MPPKPFILKQLFSGQSLEKLQLHLQNLKDQKLLNHDPQFKRYELLGDDHIKLLHQSLITQVARNVFNEPLKATYSFISCYEPGVGVCPIHVDKSPCYLTVDVCINQKSPWALYVNSEHDFSERVDKHFKTDEAENEKIKETSTPYLLMPGDALCYSGTHHAHWRNVIEGDNFCDLLFFHFVKKDYVGPK